jgi:hypothetical protein
MAGQTFADTEESYDIEDSEREDLSDLIYMLSPTECPFLMMAGRGKAKARFHEWQMDILQDAADNAQAEGQIIATADLETEVEPIRVGNHTQILSKALGVTGTAEAIDKAGRTSELSFQLAKRSKEIKRDLEFMCVGHNVQQAPGSANNATQRHASSVAQSFHAIWYQSSGLTLPSGGDHVLRGPSSGTAGADGGWDAVSGLFDVVVDCDTLRPLLESDFKTALAGAWDNGGDPTIAMVGSFNKQVISEFTGGSTRTDRSEDKRVTAAVDIYESDFSIIRVVPNRFQRSRDVFVFTPDLFKVCYLRPFHQYALAKIGDSEERVLTVEATLESNNAAGSCLIADCTSS